MDSSAPSPLPWPHPRVPLRTKLQLPPETTGFSAHPHRLASLAQIPFCSTFSCSFRLPYKPLALTSSSQGLLLGELNQDPCGNPAASSSIPKPSHTRTVRFIPGPLNLAAGFPLCSTSFRVSQGLLTGNGIGSSEDPSPCTNLNSSALSCFTCGLNPKKKKGDHH